MNSYLVVVISLLVISYLLEQVAELLNMCAAREQVPSEFSGWYDDEKYAESQRYLKEGTRLTMVESTILTLAILVFIIMGGFGVVDTLARSAGQGMILTGLIFAGILLLLISVVSLPFTLYSTFVIEERYGFNRTTLRTFVVDALKSVLLTVVLGGPVFAGILWFFVHMGPWAWCYAWLGVTLFQVVLYFVAPVIILPLFNRYTPLQDEELREALERYAARQSFSLRGIFSCDGSRRSSKANAFFTGFGPFRRVVLYDTLIEKHDVPEVLAVFAHEVGHCKRHHTLQHLCVGILSSGLMFYLLSLFISRPGLYEAFGISLAPIAGVDPVYGGLLLFGFLYAPIQMLTGIFINRWSRRCEFEADAFAVQTAGPGDSMISALKRLSVDTLANLRPHPLKVFLAYSHPPMLQRIQAIRELGKGPV